MIPRWKFNHVKSGLLLVLSSHRPSKRNKNLVYLQCDCIVNYIFFPKQNGIILLGTPHHTQSTVLKCLKWFWLRDSAHHTLRYYVIRTTKETNLKERTNSFSPLYKVFCLSHYFYDDWLYILFILIYIQGNFY